jgi:hypothetical protein
MPHGPHPCATTLRCSIRIVRNRLCRLKREQSDVPAEFRSASESPRKQPKQEIDRYTADNDPHQHHEPLAYGIIRIALLFGPDTTRWHERSDLTLSHTQVLLAAGLGDAV